MSGFTAEEAQAFIHAMRLTLEGKMGFGWMVEKLSALEEFIESLATENQRLHAYIDRTNSREDYESYTATGSDPGEGEA